MLARHAVDFQNMPQMRPNLPGTPRRIVAISKASRREGENERADESSRMRPPDKTEPAASAAIGDEARASGDKAKAIPNDRQDRQSAARRLRSQLPALAPAFSTRRRRRKVHRPKSPGFEIVESVS